MSTAESPPEIIVSPEMVDAGLHELQERSYGEDISYVLEAVFRAMAYESPQLQEPVSQDRQLLDELQPVESC